MKRRRTFNIPLSRIKRVTGWWEPQLAWFVPSGSEMYTRLNNVLLCPMCQMVYDIYRQPYNHCKNCGTELYLYRGPCYGTLEIDNKSFVIQMITNQVFDFNIIPEDEYINSVKVTVVMQNAWPALLGGYREGVYKGFYLLQPRINPNMIDKPPMATLISPMQASFYERFSLVKQGLEEGELEKKKNQNKGFEIPQSFTNLHENGIFSVPEKDLSIFTKTLGLDYHQYLKERDYLSLTDIRRKTTD